MEGGSFSKRGSRLSAAQSRLNFSLERRTHHSVELATNTSIRMDCHGATVALIRRAEVPGTASWHDSASSRRNSKVDSWR
eukprot:6020723-Pyramimonas_sp.AAC.1